MPTAGSSSLSLMTLEGDAELLQALREIGPAVERKVVARALRKGAKPIVTAARQYCRQQTKGTGLLARSLGTVERRYPHSGTLMMMVGSRRQPQYKGRANISHLIEFGHRIAVGRRLMRREVCQLLGLPVSEGSGFVAARPFLRPAFEAHKVESLAIISDEIAIGLEREAEKAAATGKRAWSIYE